MEQPAVSLLKARVYDILAHKSKLEPSKVLVGSLNGFDSSICTAICLAVDKAVEDLMSESVLMGMEAIGRTLLAIHAHGLPQGGNPFPGSESLQAVARLLNNSGGDDADQV